MNRPYLLAAAAVLLASAGCNKEQAGNVSGPIDVNPVAPPAGQQWSDVVTATEQGGFLMGNPDAAVKVVEYGSMTCPHCREFDEQAMRPLIDKYVKTGQVSFEFRNFIRDPFDLAASLIARCGGPKRFFPLTAALFEDQQNWTTRVSSAPPEQLQAVQGMPPTQQFVEIARLAGLQQWAAQRGLPSAQTNQCLANENELNRLVQMQSDAVSTYEVPGTPTFLINNEVVENTASWGSLEPAIRDALS